MKKDYQTPLTAIIALPAIHLLSGSKTPPKIGGCVVDSNGDFILGTDFGFGGDGSKDDVSDAKGQTDWDDLAHWDKW